MPRENVKIPEKHYVGLLNHHNSGLPMGFMTPWGENAAGVKRMATVDNWAKGPHSLTPMVIDNVPMSGFKLTSSIRTTDYGGYDHWRVEDPRGFVLEISGGNLAQLLSVGMIDRGEFIDECVWARHGASNVLLSTATEEYKAAVENTRVAGLKSNWKDVKLGNRIVLQNNIRGVWLGKMRGIVKTFNNSYNSTFGNNELTECDKVYHVICTNDSVSSRYTQTMHLIVNPKLSYIEDHSAVVTPADAEIKVNELLVDKSCYTVISGYSEPLLMSFDQIAGGDNLKLMLVPVSIDDAQHLREMTVAYDAERIMVKTTDGSFGVLQSNGANSNITKVSEEHIHEGEFRKLLTPNHDSRSKYINRNYPFLDDNYEYVFNANDKFFKLEVQLTTKASNTITRILHR